VRRLAHRPLGHPVGTWRAKVAGDRLDVSVQAFASLSDRQRTAIEQAAGGVALFRGRADVQVAFGAP
jgi:hypothetical protein